MSNKGILVDRGIVVTQDSHRRVIKNGSVYVENDRIVDVGKDLHLKYNAETTIDGGNKAVIPGLINAHMHSSQCLSRNIATNVPIDIWLRDVVANVYRTITVDECYTATLMECLEMIKSGTTHFVEYHRSPNLKHSDAIAKAAQDSGIRVGMTPGFSDLGPDDFIVNWETVEKEIQRLIREYHGAANGRIQIWVGPGAPGFRESLERCRQLSDLASRMRLRITMHVAETIDQALRFRRDYGQTQTEFLLKNGLLGPRALLAHMNWITDADIEIVKKADASVVHNPFANMYFGEGVAPVPSMLNRGVTLALGTDSPGNGPLDMFNVMKAAITLHRIHNLNSEIISPQAVFDAATINGSTAVGMRDHLGSIEPGKKADLVLIDLKKLHLTPMYDDIISSIVFNANGADVDTVIIDGKIILEDRKFIGHEEQRIIDETSRVAHRLSQKFSEYDWYKILKGNPSESGSRPVV